MDVVRSGRPAGVVCPSSATVVIVTRNRRRAVLRTLDRLAALRPPPPIIVVDNASDDGTPEAVAAEHPTARLVALPDNRGAAARNIGARAAATPLVAFCDDDSWWAPGALQRAGAHFSAHPRLGLLAARILVGAEQRLDPTCAQMAAGPRGPDGPGPAVVGFVACGAVVRRDAFLATGGFDPRFEIGGEEALVAWDLAARGWGLAYAEDVVAHHDPESGPRGGRSRRIVRNDLWTTWLRLPLGAGVAATLAALRRGQRGAVIEAVCGLPWVMRERRRLPPALERELRRAAGERRPRAGADPRALRSRRLRRARTG